MATYDKRYDGTYVPFEVMRWDIQRESRPWSHEEWEQTFWAMPEKLESDGMLYCSDDDRMKMLCALLENIGMDRAVRFGDPALWRAAVAALPE